MPIEVWRPGDFRLCPSCGARHKVQDLHCARCNTVLAGAPVQHAGPAPAGVAVAAARSSRGLRALLAVGVVVALGAGLWVRSLFRGAALQDSVEASSTAAVAPAPQPTWTPPMLSYPPVVGYNTGVPPSMAALTIQASPAAPAAESVSSGMTSIAPPTAPTTKTAFTNDDLARLRGQEPPVPAPVAPAMTQVATVAPVSNPAGAPMAPSRTEDEVRQWIGKVRDREDDVQQSLAKVRRLEAEADAMRAQAAATATDLEAHEKAQRAVMNALEDLEKAERKLASAQRELDETKVAARAAGVRFER